MQRTTHKDACEFKHYAPEVIVNQELILLFTFVSSALAEDIRVGACAVMQSVSVRMRSDAVSLRAHAQ